MIKKLALLIIPFVLLASCNTNSSSEKVGENNTEKSQEKKYQQITLHVLDYLQLGISTGEVKHYMEKWTNHTLLSETDDILNYEWTDENNAVHLVIFGSYVPGQLDYISYNIDLKNNIQDFVWVYMYVLEKQLERTYGPNFDMIANDDESLTFEMFTEDIYINLSNGYDYVVLTIDYAYGP
jgi:hypothetical protein